jgi:hypothetical protein
MGSERSTLKPPASSVKLSTRLGALFRPRASTSRHAVQVEATREELELHIVEVAKRGERDRHHLRDDALRDGSPADKE